MDRISFHVLQLGQKKTGSITVIFRIGAIEDNICSSTSTRGLQRPKAYSKKTLVGRLMESIMNNLLRILQPLHTIKIMYYSFMLLHWPVRKKVQGYTASYMFPSA